MYKDLKNSPFYKNTESPYNRTQVSRSDPFYNNETEIDPEVRYGFEPKTISKYSQKNSDFDFDSFEDKGFDYSKDKDFDYSRDKDFYSSEDKEYEYRSKQKTVQAKSTNLNKYDDEHFFKHEEECEVCDYIEVFQNMDRNKFGEMFVFSEVIGKPKALRKK